jgi:aerobic carbon-monoxide dehydrogenase medium subunit
MKPAPFDYHAPTSTGEAVELLAEFGDRGRVLAGGQSLFQLMNFRVVKPENLIDINPVTELDYIRSDNGTLAIGARTRQSTLERSREAAEWATLMVEAVKNVAHPSVRNRGTVGGSVAYADPASELPAVVLAMDGELVLTSGQGQRTLAAADFFRGPYTNACSADELLTEVRLPEWPSGTGHAFLEFKRKHGSYALMGTAVLMHLDGESVDRVSISLCGVDETPVRASQAEDIVVGNVPTDEVFEEAAAAAVPELNPLPDPKGSPEYRRKLAKVYIRRALELAVRRAKGERS